MRTKWEYIPNTNQKYMISNTGLVKSFMLREPFIMKPGKVYKKNVKGYRERVSFTLADGTRQREMVHRLVAMVFIPNPNNYPEVNHKDGNKLNNNQDNLEWCTQQQNAYHAYHVLGHKQLRNIDRSGQNNGSAKLTQEDVDNIRATAKNKNITQKDLAKQYGITRTGINQIINNKRWTKQ